MSMNPYHLKLSPRQLHPWQVLSTMPQPHWELAQLVLPSIEASSSHRLSFILLCVLIIQPFLQLFKVIPLLELLSSPPQPHFSSSIAFRFISLWGLVVSRQIPIQALFHSPSSRLCDETIPPNGQLNCHQNLSFSKSRQKSQLIVKKWGTDTLTSKHHTQFFYQLGFEMQFIWLSQGRSQLRVT